MHADLNAIAAAAARTPRRSATGAAFLSFLWPGLGQLYRRRPRSALVQALPPLLVVLALAIVAVGGVELLALRLLIPAVALGAIAVVAVLALWRIVSIFDARRTRSSEPPDSHPRRSLVAAVVLAAIVVASHGVLGYYAFSFYRAGAAIFEPITGGQPTPTPTQTPAVGPTTTPGDPSAPTAVPTATPRPSPVIGDRINVLFVGIDRGINDNTNTDTLLLASFDPRTDEIAMISLPRDIAQVPLYTGGTWNRKINSLYQYAATHPEEFPDGGMGTLVREMEFLLGVPIDYYASVELGGFRQMIDLVGGVDVVLEKPIQDPTYQHSPDRIGFFMEPGPHHLDGATALAYVRSRHGPGGSDFERARRQQQVILALRQRLRDPQVLLNLPALLDAAAETVRSDVPTERLPELVELVQSSQGADARQVVLAPRRFAQRIPPEEIGGAYAIRLRMDEVAALSVELFGDDSRYSSEPAPPSTAEPDDDRSGPGSRFPGRSP